MALTSKLTVELIPALKDNYIAVIYGFDDPHQDFCIVVDPSDDGGVNDFINSKRLKVSTLLCTHHHADHIGGVLGLKTRHGCKVLTSAYDVTRIEGADYGVKDQERLNILGTQVKGISIPGHTLGHMAFYFEKEQILFSGDTLFSAGCGRLFEGSHAQLFHSLKKLAELPDETHVFCGHEYTLKNLEWALTLKPKDPNLLERSQEVRALRDSRSPTLPSTLAIEKCTNLFLQATSIEEFKRLRESKDHY